MAVFSLATKREKAKEEKKEKLKRLREELGEDESVDGDEEEYEESIVLDEDDGLDDDDDEAEEEEEEEEEPVAPVKETKNKNKKAKKDDSHASSKSNGNSSLPNTAVEFSEPAQWVERMALTSTRSLPADLKADDDPKREEAFIQQTLLSVTQGLQLLEAAGVPYRRPADYYAEMFKSDVHMNDVRQAMEATKARVEAQTHRRAMKDQKKYGKEVQAEVLRQRAKYKRDMQSKLDDWRKKRKGNIRDALGEDETEETDKKGGRGARPAPHRNIRPGGAKKRPGKNARRRS